MYILTSARAMDTTIMTKEQQAESMREEDYRKAVRNAVQRIQGK
jgi:hypothetical protein